jgi:hypothetical protein
MSPDPFGTSAQWINNAEQVRRAWLEMMGMPDEYIDLQISSDPPTDVDEELTQYNAMCRIQECYGN